MNEYKRKKSILLVSLHLFLAVGAIGGGIILLIDPSGELAGISLLLLDGSLFNSYFIPGLILFLLLGILPIIVATGLIKQWDSIWLEKLNIYKTKHWSLTFSLYIGFALIIWIIMQVFIIKTLFILQFIFIMLGIIIQIVTLLPLVQRNYLKDTKTPLK